MIQTLNSDAAEKMAQASAELVFGKIKGLNGEVGRAVRPELENDVKLINKYLVQAKSGSNIDLVKLTGIISALPQEDKLKLADSLTAVITDLHSQNMKSRASGENYRDLYLNDERRKLADLFIDEAARDQLESGNGQPGGAAGTSEAPAMNPDEITILMDGYTQRFNESLKTIGESDMDQSIKKAHEEMVGTLLTRVQKLPNLSKDPKKFEVERKMLVAIAGAINDLANARIDSLEFSTSLQKEEQDMIRAHLRTLQAAARTRLQTTKANAQSDFITQTNGSKIATTNAQNGMKEARANAGTAKYQTQEEIELATRVQQLEAENARLNTKVSGYERKDAQNQVRIAESEAELQFVDQRVASKNLREISQNESAAVNSELKSINAITTAEERERKRLFGKAPTNPGAREKNTALGDLGVGVQFTVGAHQRQIARESLAGARQLRDELISKGYRRIGYIEGGRVVRDEPVGAGAPQGPGNKTNGSGEGQPS